MLPALTLAAGLAITPWAPAQGQDSPPAFTLRTRPDTLREGSLGWLQVSLDSSVNSVAGEAAGEPLHFQRSDRTTARALIAIPVGTDDSLALTIALERGGKSDTARVWLPVQRANYPDEMLSVAPGYARPDSAATARIQAEIARSRRVARESQERPRLWRGPFQLPRRSRITSRFGTGRLFNGEVQSRHLGTDFAGAIGAPVLAAGRGIVALVADFYLAGRAVYIDHGAGLVTAYFHLSRIDVREKQMVRAGQRIGAVGRSGRVTGPHLHWVARYGGISVDPMSLLLLVKGEK